MKDFADLYTRLDATTSSNAKLAAMRDYFRQAPPADGAWAAYFLAGGKPRQLVPTKILRQFIMDAAGIPEWLFEESYQAVGDLAETLSLLLPDPGTPDTASLAEWVEERLLPLRGLPPAEILYRLRDLFGRLDQHGRFVCAKLMTGAMRVGVSKLLLTRALAEVAGVETRHMSQRLIGYTDIGARPQADVFARLLEPVSHEGQARVDGQPYPFFLAHPLNADVAAFDDLLGPPAGWQVEWKWDGIRAQLVRRAEQTWVWSRGEELVTERFPELMRLGTRLPEGTVLDGEIVVWREDRVQPFAHLQQRLGRKTVGARLLAEAPVVLLAYDLLEFDGEDLRGRTQAERRAMLERLADGIRDPALVLSPLLRGADWQDLARQREASRALGVEGMMLKAADARYGVGRTKESGVWWKWKVDPFSVDAVLIYAQRGHGRRASLYTDYTFAVWDAPPESAERRLVPFAKAYSGLTDEEIRQVDAIVRKTTVEKFGPVRSLEPTQVFELGFEGIARSSRHKSGIAVRFPRMLRWRQDKTPQDADTLETLAALLPDGSGGPST
ncbi:ATP-dependent DNA ligase [Bordetella bronchialis]|uniref:DNA ligase (ATP) n=1 Tax=Bordetella bronchialis TaxID=463025 RepID=A0ABM6CTT2_9BORD|nr:ATP-dependent DNA ligase [Bordetella bronchialis]ANN67484.1 ATP-dependent DNA ligase [Bordetella bronchialis]